MMAVHKGIGHYGAPITLDQAKKVMAAAEAKAIENNWYVAISIVDSGGNPVMLHRLDGTQLASIRFKSNVPAGGEADFSWDYNVRGDPILTDAFLAISGSPGTGGGIIVSETLGTGQTLEIRDPPGPNAVTALLNPPVVSTSVFKDDFIIGGTASGFAGVSTQSELTNAFSVPGPIVGAGLPGMVAACGALLALARRRRRLVA
jgi:hypothetical protein